MSNDILTHEILNKNVIINFYLQIHTVLCQGHLLAKVMLIIKENETTKCDVIKIRNDCQAPSCSRDFVM